MLQDPGELVVVEHAILDGRLPVHLIHATEGILDDVLRVCALQSLAKQGEEHGEVDW